MLKRGVTREQVMEERDSDPRWDEDTLDRELQLARIMQDIWLNDQCMYHGEC